jgi:hypothetical protein
MSYKYISIFKKLSLFRDYKKVISAFGSELNTKFNLRIDDANRLYTVINIPEEIVGEAYSIRKADIDRISEAFIKEYMTEVGSFLNTKGLTELYEVYEIKKVDKFSYLIVIGYSMFRSDSRREKIMRYWLPITVSSVILLPLLAYIFKLLFF